VAFFLGVLIEKRRAGGLVGSKGYREEREIDEELMAYVSGDLQASPENSWIWTGSEMSINIVGSSGAGKIGASPTLRGGREEGTNVLTDVEARDWGGWERVEYLVGVLAQEQGGCVQSVYGSGSSGWGMYSDRNQNQDRNRGVERMSITNII
jgi:hypothetical protein